MAGKDFERANWAQKGEAQASHKEGAGGRKLRAGGPGSVSVGQPR